MNTFLALYLWLMQVLGTPVYSLGDTPNITKGGNFPAETTTGPNGGDQCAPRSFISNGF